MNRLLSLDTFRGAVLMLLCLEATNYGWQHAIADAYPNWFARLVEFHAGHVPWVGCSLWDLIQPAFMFMVGVSMAYSYAKRARLGHSRGQMLRHVGVRAVVLILLGVFLRSNDANQTFWTFEDVVSQIGLGYVFLFLLWNRPLAHQLGVGAAILAGYWLLFALWPVTEPAGFEWDDPAPHLFSGFLAHWNINANPAHQFDVWLLNLLPRQQAFEFHPEGYNTLNFIPSLPIMILGLAAGEILRSDRSDSAKLNLFAIAGAAGILMGLLLHFAGICPLVKKTWTPAFTLFSGGWCLLVLAGLFYLIDVLKVQRWTFPFVVCGMNSIALYMMIWLLPGWLNSTLQTHLGQDYARFAGEPFEPLLQNLAVAALLWLICLWMYRRKIFLRI